MMRSIVSHVTAIVDSPLGKFEFRPVKYVGLPHFSIKSDHSLVRAHGICSHCRALEGGRNALACRKPDCPLK